MKKVVLVLLLVMFSGYNVYAQDMIHALKEFDNSELTYMINKPNENIVAGNYLDKNSNSHLMVINYNNSGNIVWKYTIDSEFSNHLYGLVSNDNDEYIIIVKKVSNEDVELPLEFIKLDSSGKMTLEKSTELPQNAMISKFIKITSKESETSSFIVTGSLNNKSFIAKYNDNLDEEWFRQFDTNYVADIIYIDHIGFYDIEYTIGEQKLIYTLNKLDTEGVYVSTISNSFSNNDQPHLLNDNESYILYGYTDDVKIDNDTGSYYIRKYDYSDSLEWETVGTSLVDYNEIIKLQVLGNEKYLILTTNKKDKSIELTKILDFGITQEKIKKLKNNYYHINSFTERNESIFLIGQITCPDDDNCDYNKNALFLISTPEKVVEVKEKDGKSIIIIAVILVIGTIVIYTIRKSKKKH